MIRYLFLTATTAMVTSFVGPAALAQSMGDYSSSSEDGVGGEAIEAPGIGQLSPAVSAAVVNILREGQAFCAGIQRVSSEYTIDCIAERFQRAANQMAGNPAYTDARSALTDAARKLNRIARENRDTEADTKRFTGGGQTNARPLVPVAPARQAAANEQAIAVIEEAETVLLRSSEGTPEREAQFLQIAEAVGSNKVLLRTVN